MKLLTKEIREQLPPLGATDEVVNPIARVKFFAPWTNWTWFAVEFDDIDLFYGLVVGLETELGYFSLRELESVRGPAGLTIERDLYFKPTTIRELQKDHS